MGRPPRKKGAIERSALELFVEKGVDGTSIRDIAERAEVTEGALYRHHKSKDDLVRALFFVHYESFAKLISSINIESATYEQVIRDIVSAFFEFYEEDPYIFQFVMLVRHKLLEEVRADHKNPVELLSRIVNNAQSRGEIQTADPALLTQMILGMVLQIAMGKRFGRITEPLTAYTDTVTQSILNVSKMPVEEPAA